MEPLLKRLNQDDYQLILNHCRKKEFQKGEFIFKEGVAAERFYFIQEGEVRVFKKMTDEREVTIFVREKKDGVGEIGVFSGNHYSNSAQATEKTIIYDI